MRLTDTVPGINVIPRPNTRRCLEQTGLRKMGALRPSHAPLRSEETRPDGWRRSRVVVVVEAGGKAGEEVCVCGGGGG